MLLRQFPSKEQFRLLSEKYNVIPVCAEILSDMETPVSILGKRYRQKGPAFLLESAEGGERWGRYSFFSSSAKARVRVFSDHITVAESGRVNRIAHQGDPLRGLRQLMQRYRPADIPELPRFWCGLVGYITYEMVSFFESIPHQWPPEKPLADFMIPDELLIFDNIRHTLQLVEIRYLTDSSEAESEYRAGLKRIDAIREALAQPLREPVPPDETAALRLTPLLSEEKYREMVTRVKQYIYDGDIIQSVISQPFVCDAAPDAFSLYRAQRYINPSPYLYFLHLDDMVLVGSSPETMVRLENNIAVLRPIAGTRPRGRTEQADRDLADELLQDEKERAEHLMLVDLGRNDLGRIAETGTVEVTDLMFIERYSHVMHLVSNIQCDLKPDVDAWALLAATFPAGTLSGAPKIRAMEIIAEMENRPRGPYGGAVGYISFHGNMDMAITIRTACIEARRMTVQAGAGIVADSDPERERQETVNKAMALQQALKLIRPDRLTD
ncbi:MAG: chorismate-binding protein [Desulfobacterales bacterium]|nr:chorismate-binding protein [Desulfobacterales bacterium]